MLVLDYENDVHIGKRCGISRLSAGECAEVEMSVRSRARNFARKILKRQDSWRGASKKLQLRPPDRAVFPNAQ
jgi:hypothetical protein